MLPDYIHSESELEETLAEPSEADLACVRRVAGDVLILGAGGKMGPSLARRVRRAVERTGARIDAWRRPGSRLPTLRAQLEADGIPTLACDLLDRASVAALPRMPHVLFLAGRKFGTLDRTDLTWATNTVVPATVAEHFHDVADGRVLDRQRLSAGCRRTAPGPRKTTCRAGGRVRAIVPGPRARRRVRLARARAPCADVPAQLRGGSALRHARRHRPPGIRRRSRRPDRWLLQCDLAGRCEQLCTAQPRAVLVAAGRAQRHRPRTHLPFATPRSGSARRSDGRRGSRTRRARSPCSATRAAVARGSVSRMSRSRGCSEWVAHWVEAGGASLNKPTHFEVADGRF